MNHVRKQSTLYPSAFFQRLLPTGIKRDIRKAQTTTLSIRCEKRAFN